MPPLPEHRESLWFLAASPAIWAGHFLLCYITAAVWCARVAGRLGTLGGARTAIAAYTVVALAGIGVIGWKAYQRQRLGSGRTPHDFDTPEDRHRFLGFAALLLSGLSAIAVLYVVLTIAFIGTCH